MDENALQMIAVNLGPWAFVAYLVFQLLSSALQRRHEQSRTSPRTGADPVESLSTENLGSAPQK